MRDSTRGRTIARAREACIYFGITRLGRNPDFALGRGIRRTMPDFFVLKRLDRSHRYALAFFVEKVLASFVSVLTPNAKSGL